MASKSDAAVKLVLVFVISLLSFAVGTFVGKKYSDQQHKVSAYEPTGDGSHETASHSEHAKPSEHAGAQMSDEEIAKLAEEFVTDDAEEGADKTAATEKHESIAETAHAVAVAAPTTKKAAVAPAETVHEPRQPAAVPKYIPKDVSQYPTAKFTVQIASFNSETDAKQRAEELKHKGFSAFYIPAQIQGKTWYRVSVGQFPSEQEAKNYRTEFMQKTKTESAIIQKIVH